MRGSIWAAVLACLALAWSASPADALDDSSDCGPNQIVCPPDSPTTEGDQSTGSVVTSGVQFPGVDADSALGKATAAHADCRGCEWIISPACIANGAGDSSACMGATDAC